jgi:NADH dehydrogenase [ubiquinone] 1 alpha subcomplex assembly factor 6
MIIPAEISAKHGVNQDEVFRFAGEAKGRGKQSVKGLEDAVFEFATVANDHVITARDMFKDTAGKVPREAMPVFLGGVRFLPHPTPFFSYVRARFLTRLLV